MPDDFAIIKDALSRIGAINDLETENALLRKVVDAARGVFLGEGEHLCSEFEDAIDRLEQALAELDKEGVKNEKSKP